MRSSNLKFIRDTKEMRQLFYEPSLHKTAQEQTDVMARIEEAAKGIYDKDHPVESILAFIGPGLLWNLGFPWVAVIYEIAAALGFDWSHFFTSIKDKIKPILEHMVETKSGDTSHVSSVVQSAAAEAFSDHINPDKVEEVVNKYGTLDNMLYLKKFAQKYAADQGLKDIIVKFFTSIGGNRMRKGILGFIVRLFSWMLSAVLISLGFALVGGLASKIIGTKDKKEKTEKSDKAVAVSETEHLPTTELKLNHQASPELFTTTFNDDKHSWLLQHNINQLHDLLIKWAQELYPQLQDKNAFDTTSSFQHTFQMFKDHNKNAEMDLIVVPPPFTSIKSIVDSFANDVAVHTQEKN